MRFESLLLPFAALICLSSGSSWAAQATSPQLPEGMRRVTTVEGITEYSLPNGLRVLLFPDPTQETITVNITYLVGSKHENYGETGMAHLLEHLVFKGTPKHPNIPKELTEHGARPNGTTWLDRTNYFETFKATQANLDWALDLEADRMLNSFIAKKDLDSEMTVVRNELEIGENDPFSVLVERMTSTAYLWHNYGKSTIGARSDLENVPIERLQAFYRTYYQPDNAMLVVAGKLDEAQTLKLVHKHFGPLPRPSRVLPAFYTVEPTQDGERDVTVRRVGETQLVGALYHLPAGGHPDAPAAELLGMILSDEPAGRLYKALVESKKASRLSGMTFQFREPGFTLILAELRQESSLADARATLIQILDGLKQTPITAEELERVRARRLKELELEFNSSEAVGIGLSEWAALGDWRLRFLYRDWLKQVTLADIERVAAAYFVPSNRTTGQFIPESKPVRAEIGAGPEVAELLKDYAGGDGVALGEAFDPSPENIEARTQRKATRQGMRLVLLPKSTRGDSVQLVFRLHFGNLEALNGLRAAGELVPGMLMRGSSGLNRQQLHDRLIQLKANLRIRGGAVGLLCEVETTAPQLPAVLALLAEVLQKPTFPAQEFEQLRQEQLVDLERQLSEPRSLVWTAAGRHLNPYPPGDPRYTPTLPEKIAEIKGLELKSVQDFYSRFYGASASELAIVGKFDAKSIEKQVLKLFQGWSSPIPYREIPRPYQPREAVSLQLLTPDKASASLTAVLPFQLSDDDPDYPALVLGNFLLGGGFISSRLATRLRQQEGISYTVGSWLGGTPRQEGASFRVFAMFAPENAAKAEGAIREELARALKDGFTPEEVAAARDGYFQGRQVRRSKDDELAGALAEQSQYGRTMAYDAGVEQRIRELTPEQLVETLRKYLDPAALSFFVAGDLGAVKQ